MTIKIAFKVEDGKSYELLPLGASANKRAGARVLGQAYANESKYNLVLDDGYAIIYFKTFKQLRWLLEESDLAKSPIFAKDAELQFVCGRWDTLLKKNSDIAVGRSLAGHGIGKMLLTLNSWYAIWFGPAKDVPPGAVVARIAKDRGGIPLGHKFISQRIWAYFRGGRSLSDQTNATVDSTGVVVSALNSIVT